jgi:hypothetical protein
MYRTSVVVIGAGQAGLAVSHLRRASALSTWSWNVAALRPAETITRGSRCGCRRRTG